MDGGKDVFFTTGLDALCEAANFVEGKDTHVVRKNRNPHGFRHAKRNGTTFFRLKICVNVTKSHLQLKSTFSQSEIELLPLLFYIFL